MLHHHVYLCRMSISIQQSIMFAEVIIFTWKTWRVWEDFFGKVGVGGAGGWLVIIGAFRQEFGGFGVCFFWGG